MRLWIFKWLVPSVGLGRSWRGRMDAACVGDADAMGCGLHVSE